MDKHVLRQQLKQARQALDPQTVKTHSEQICRQLLDSPEIQSSEHIAVYHAMPGEVELQHLIDEAWGSNKSCYLPIIEAQQLVFVRYRQESKLQPNQYGIFEPLQHEPIELTELDTIVCPLLGFDEHGCRLGMGKGHYDKTLANLSDAPPPFLIGVAHEQQKCEQLPQDPWDIPLTAVVTETGFYRF